MTSFVHVLHTLMTHRVVLEGTSGEHLRQESFGRPDVVEPDSDTAAGQIKMLVGDITATRNISAMATAALEELWDAGRHKLASGSPQRLHNHSRWWPPVQRS